MITALESLSLESCSIESCRCNRQQSGLLSPLKLTGLLVLLLLQVGLIKIMCISSQECEVLFIYQKHKMFPSLLPSIPDSGLFGAVSPNLAGCATPPQRSGQLPNPQVVWCVSQTLHNEVSYLLCCGWCYYKPIRRLAAGWATVPTQSLTRNFTASTGFG